MRHLGLRCGFCVLLLLTASDLLAQRVWITPGPFLRFGYGPSISETDFSTYAIEPYALKGEIGYQFPLGLSLGLAYEGGNYPKVSRVYHRFHIIQGLLRWRVFPYRRLSHYFNIGPHITLGGYKTGFGLNAALGADYVLTRNVAFFVEASANAVFPDRAAEGIRSGRAAFDGLGFLGAGLRITLKPLPIPIRTLTIEGPAQLQRREYGIFTARVDDEATRPISYVWFMGDGTQYTGPTIEHRYRLPGRYEIQVQARNAAGIVRTATHLVEVVERPRAVRIVSFQPLADTIRRGNLITFEAQIEGAPHIRYFWNFGDGNVTLTTDNQYRLEEGLRAGTMSLRAQATHRFDKTGVYTVSLVADNELGRDSVQAQIVVKPNACDLITALESVTFDFGKSSLNESARAVLDQNVRILQSCPDLIVQLVGYADYVGGEAFNTLLSLRRALAVYNYYQQQGIAPERLIFRGLGALPPPCPNPEEDRPGCRQLRRVDTIIIRWPR
ncbi:OmpA family protein [Rhodothermus profundi]|uniref:Outer membrane protein OmpA n=1 Tax=Rhodothermus profundi TaxID=633813 RepID=A0A1M6PNU0_9BACT|nr:OmpA family protein [Rhodothermus profundi]SHK09518.1 Outer membrane protein OmpA [Rhodothermus profundi]